MRKKIGIGIINLTTRSVFHAFVSGALYIFAFNLWKIDLLTATVIAFVCTATFEFLEGPLKIDNTFTKRIFTRDIILCSGALIAVLLYILTQHIIIFLIFPIILLILTIVLHEKTKKIERSNVKPFFDILSFSIGPLLFTILFP